MTSTAAHPVFSQPPTFGPRTLRQRLCHLILRLVSSVLSISFLLLVVLCTLFSSVLSLWEARRRDPTSSSSSRPFWRVEQERVAKRREDERVWKVRRRDSQGGAEEEDEKEKGVRKKWRRRRRSRRDDWGVAGGGEDALLCDVGYYARRVGLEVEEVEVVTEDGFVIALQHVFDPDDPPYYPAEEEEIEEEAEEEEEEEEEEGEGSRSRAKERRLYRRKYPVLLMHGLLQSSGAFCVNDEDSLAFYLCKSGYDVWLGNNRCGYNPKHTTLHHSDPRMWSWNIQQMGTLDLPALISHVLRTTRFSKLGLVCHSQGTTQTFVALAKHQRPDIGSQISVFCALAPAAYAGPLMDRSYFKFISSLSPRAFKLIFGLHAFIPFMMTVHSYLPPKLYGRLGYRVFWFLFGWSDERWDRGLRDRFFRFAPVYVSAEAMRWWLGRDCFAKHKCILSTPASSSSSSSFSSYSEQEKDFYKPGLANDYKSPKDDDHSAWYDHRCPPMALWVAGSDHLVDGQKLLDRFQNGSEPSVRLLHAKTIKEYEHLDVIWAIDAPEKVFAELVDVLWSSVEEAVKAEVVVPVKPGGGNEEVGGSGSGISK